MKHLYAYRFFSKIKSSFFMALFIVVFASTKSSYIKAAVNGSTFSNSTSTYTAITGTTLFSGIWEDAASASLTIPFSFLYNGLSFTTSAVSTNGFITLGAVPATTYCGLQAIAVNSIAGYGTDLVNSNTTSSIVYATFGTSPNQKFIVQYTDCKHYNATGVLYSFQIILNKTSNNVQVIYGPTTSTTTMGASDNVSC